MGALNVIYAVAKYDAKRIVRLNKILQRLKHEHYSIGMSTPFVKAKMDEGFLPLVRHFEKRPHYFLLGLDFSPLGAECGGVLLEIGVRLLAHAEGRPD